MMSVASCSETMMIKDSETRQSKAIGEIEKVNIPR